MSVGPLPKSLLSGASPRRRSSSCFSRRDTWPPRFVGPGSILPPGSSRRLPDTWLRGDCRVASKSVPFRGADFWIAYAPMDYGLALPSGPAANVFDDQGRLVDWSADTGDDSRFPNNWPSKAMTPGSIEDLNRLAVGSASGPRGDAGRSATPVEVPR